MVERKLTIVNPTGLHARPATKVVDYVKIYDGKVEIIKGDTVCNLKSILSLLAMGLRQGTEVTLRVTGEHEREYMDELCEFILNLKE